MKTCFIAMALLVAFVCDGQVITTIAGGGTGIGDGDSASHCSLYLAVGVAIDSKNNLYISTSFENRIRKVNTATNIITTIAGTGDGGFYGDGGLATEAHIGFPNYIAIDKYDNLFFEDSSKRIRRIDAASGIITTIAGIGVCGYSGDGGLAANASICGSAGLAFDRQNNLYFADLGNEVVRKIDTNGVITTVAGNSLIGYSGDGGPANLAKLHQPYSVALDSVANLYIADFLNQRIRVVDHLTGIITTFAGSGTGIYNGEQISALDAGFNPIYIAFDRSGNLVVADYYNERIRKITTNHSIVTVAGNGITGFSGDDSAAINAEMHDPESLAFDSCGNIFFSDHANSRVREIGYTACNVVDTSHATSLSAMFESTFSLSPNPAINEVTIQASTPINNVAITNLVGQVVYHQTYNAKKVIINIAALPVGVYFVKVNERYVGKLVKE